MKKTVAVRKETLDYYNDILKHGKEIHGRRDGDVVFDRHVLFNLETGETFMLEAQIIAAPVDSGGCWSQAVLYYLVHGDTGPMWIEATYTEVLNYISGDEFTVDYNDETYALEIVCA